MNPRLGRLETYPFEKLARLLAGVEPARALAPIALSIGEPQHAAPALLLEALTEGATRLASYPPTAGGIELRTAAAHWLERRFSLPPDAVDPLTMVLPVNGSREALFSFVQAAVDPTHRPLVAMPNPFYQIYEGATLLAGAEPYLLDTTAQTHFVPPFASVPPEVWARCQILILCSPSNPTGAVLTRAELAQALALADEHDFIIAADECYADIYLDERTPPASLLEAALAAGHTRFERCIVFHSLSKRSSVPGLRSGFVAGDPQLLRPYLLYRTYHGGAMSPMIQHASAAAWNDDAHAARNRALYREKFAAVLPILGPLLQAPQPAGAFYLWADTGGDDERFVRELYATHNVKLLPGSYLARRSAAGNPGAGRVRISLTASLEDCLEAAERIREFLR